MPSTDCFTGFSGRAEKITTVRSSVGTPKIRRASIPFTMITSRKYRTFLCGNPWATKKGPRFDKLTRTHPDPLYHLPLIAPVGEGHSSTPPNGSSGKLISQGPGLRIHLLADNPYGIEPHAGLINKSHEDRLVATI